MIVVTGGAGFIGSHLCERLVREGHQVISLDNYFAGSRDNHVPGVDYREGHTKDIEELISERPDMVYHLGEYSRVEKSFEDIEQVWDLNQLGTFAVLEFVRQRNAKLVYAGSSTKFADNEVGANQSPYAWSKATSTELVKNYARWFGISYAITYFYNVYGPRERSGALGTVIAMFKENYRQGKPLTVVLPGTQRRNFTHVEDIVDGLVRVGAKGEGDEFGLGDERSYTVSEIAELFGTDIVMLPERKGNRTASGIDTSKAKSLGWEIRHSVVENINEFVRTTIPTAVRPESRVLVFTTTFFPVAGPAEEALCALMEQMPDIHFDIVTTKYVPGADDAVCPVPNATVHRIGNGTSFDKFLLPFSGAALGRRLASEHRYLFVWSLMASYGTLAAMQVRSTNQLPLLVTLADQVMSWRLRTLLPFVLRNTDQVYASTTEQERHVVSLTKRMRGMRSVGTGDTISNAIRFAYNSLLQSK